DEEPCRVGSVRFQAKPLWCPLEDPDRARARGSLSALAGLDDDLALLNVADQVESLGRAPLLLPLRGQADVGKGLLDPVHDLDVVAVDRVEAGDRLLVAEADAPAQREASEEVWRAAVAVHEGDAPQALGAREVAVVEVVVQDRALAPELVHEVLPVAAEELELAEVGRPLELFEDRRRAVARLSEHAVFPGGVVLAQ